MRHFIAVFVALLALAGLLAWFLAPKGIAPERTANLEQRGGIAFEIADTPATRARGLSGRGEIPPDYGMLFVFPEEGVHGFWMKDMLVPIDILWLRADGTILGIEEAVAPDAYPRSFYPPEPIRYVLEMRAGEAARQGFSAGSDIELPL